MRTPASAWGVARRSAIVGVEDLKSYYTWRTWVFGWLLRVILQVLFYAFVGRQLGSAGEVRFLLVGGACSIAALEALVVVQMSTFDRQFGTMAMLVTVPSGYFLTYVFRNLNYVVTGTVTATLSLFAGAFILDVHLDLPRTILATPLIFLGALSAYFLGAFVGMLIAAMGYGRFIAQNVTNLSLFAVCGFVIPVDYWPTPITRLAEVLPFSHALSGIRGVVEGHPASEIVHQCSLEVLVALGWFVLAKVLTDVTVEWGRRKGTLELLP